MNANDESKSIYVTFTTRRETCSPVHINSVQLPKKKISSILGYTLTGDLTQTHFLKTETTRNHPHQNVLVTRTKVKTLHKQQTAHI
jgi:hypothetical protein